MFLFFCKQKTAYEMRIRDWSSDVCSSDLPHRGGEPGAEAARLDALEQAIEDEGAKDARDDDDAAAAGERPSLGGSGQHREAGGNQEIEQPHRDDRTDRKSTRLHSSH